jgi:hypothetical protein
MKTFPRFCLLILAALNVDARILPNCDRHAQN